MATKRNVSVLQKRLKMALEAESYYEALQLYQTIAFRLMEEGHSDSAQDILTQGAERLIQAGESNSAVELLIQLFESYRKTGKSHDDENVQEVVRKFEELLPPGQARVQFLTTSTKFMNGDGKEELSAEQVLSLAESHYTAGNYGMAQKFYLKLVSVNSLGNVIVKWSSKCAATEKDMLIVRPVLVYLSRGLLDEGKDLFKYICTHVPSADFPQTPLINYIGLLFKALEKKSLPFFNMLKTAYEESINRDPAFSGLIDSISSKFFQTPQRSNGLQNLFGDILRGFLSPGNQSSAQSSSNTHMNIDPLD